MNRHVWFDQIWRQGRQARAAAAEALRLCRCDRGRFFAARTKVDVVQRCLSRHIKRILHFVLPLVQINCAFLTRISVAVAPVVVRCIKRCTSRKGIVIALTTTKERPKMEKICQHEKSQNLSKESPRAARLLLQRTIWWKRRGAITMDLCTPSGSNS